MALQRLTYHSRHFGLTKPQLGEILEVARRKNAELGITGVLMHHDRSFLQVLEGPPPVVRYAYAQIRVDPRHHQIELIGDERAEHRLFPGWAMGCVELDREGYGAIVRFLGRRMSKVDELLLRFAVTAEVG